MKPRGLATRISLTLPSYNTRRATCPKTISNYRQWKERRKRGMETDRGRRKKRWRWRVAKRKRSLSDFFTFQKNLKIHCCFLHNNKEHLTGMHDNYENLHDYHTNVAKTTPVYITDVLNVKVRSQKWSTAYPSPDVRSQRRQRELVKHAQWNKNHLRVTEHWVKAKTWWLWKRWHVWHCTRSGGHSSVCRAESLHAHWTHQHIGCPTWSHWKNSSSSKWQNCGRYSNARVRQTEGDMHYASVAKMPMTVGGFTTITEFSCFVSILLTPVTAWCLAQH